MARSIKMPGDDIAGVMEAESRQPVMEALASLLVALPNPDALQAFADRYPDRWAQAIMILAKLSGFSEKLQIDVTARSIGALSDTELELEAERVRGELGEAKKLRSCPN